jgi:very-short-patch-repair endonuclease
MHITKTDRYQPLAEQQGLIPSVSLPEIVLWHRVLKNHKLDGLHFTRNQQAESGCTTFVCADIHLIIGIMAPEIEICEEARFDAKGNHLLYFSQKRVLYSIEHVRKEIFTIVRSLKATAQAG